MSVLFNQRGQMAVEYILVAAVMMMIATFLRIQIQQQEILAKFISSPWSTLSGVIENGVMGAPAKTKSQHPNLLYRHSSMKGDEGQ